MPNAVINVFPKPAASTATLYDESGNQVTVSLSNGEASLAVQDKTTSEALSDVLDELKTITKLLANNL